MTQRLALITGASSGIGEALAKRLHKEGIQLILTGRNKERLDKVAEATKGEAVICDLSRFRERRTLVDLIRKRAPDIVINCAGVSCYGKVIDTAPSRHLEIIRINIEAAAELTLEAIQAWKKRKKAGTVMNISSLAGDYTFPSLQTYASSKAFLTRWSEAIDFELEGTGIRVLASCPGVVNTRFRVSAGGKKREKSGTLTMSAERAAEEIWQQIGSGKAVHRFSLPYRILGFFSRFLPKRTLFKKLQEGISSVTAERKRPSRKRDDKTAAPKAETPAKAEEPSKPEEPEGRKFSDWPLKPEILRSLARMGFKAPTPIQEQTLDVILGGHDLIGLAQTGSGKTAACAIPVCQRVDTARPEIQALILVPTRELALQYATETQKIGELNDVHSLAVFGGAAADLQLAKLRHKVHVCVATPGRLIDFIYSRQIDLSKVETVVLDEADEMLSMGFYEDLEFIFNCLTHEHQTLLFSATMPKEIRSIAEKHMKAPKEVKLIQKVAAPSTIAHRFVSVAPRARTDQLRKLIDDQKPNQSIVFVDSRKTCEELFHDMRKKVDGCEFIHGGLSQEIRTTLTDKFRRGKIRHLIATDVAARGLDFSGVTHVFMWQLPRDVDTYIHRSGRTGRQKRTGTVITMVSRRDMEKLDAVCARIKQKPEWIGEAPSEGRSNGGGSNRSSSKPRQRRPRRRDGEASKSK